jgi:hypothetical protein
MMKRQSRLQMLLTDEERGAAEREAQRLGMTLSAWVRYIIRPRLGLAVANDAPLTS